MLQRKESRHEPDASDEGTVEEQGVMAKHREDGGAEGREGLVPEGTGWGRCGDQKGRPSSPEKGEGFKRRATLCALVEYRDSSG